jgi:hypothetical protein
VKEKVVMKRAPLLVVLLVAGAAGCSLLRLGGEPDPEKRMELGLAALGQGDLTRAQEHLHWVYSHHGESPVGRRALLVLVAAELDPRNESRRLWAAADMSAKLLSQAGSPEWVEPVAETLYLLALELGANEERIARAEAERDSAQALPELPGPSVLAQVQTLREERDNLRRRAQALEQVVAAKEKELKEKEQELERIRKTLKG